MDDGYVHAAVVLREDIDQINFKGYKEAEKAFQELGFDIVFETSAAFSIGGLKSRFEEVFKTKFDTERDDETGVVSYKAEGGITLPQSLKKYCKELRFTSFVSKR